MALPAPHKTLWQLANGCLDHAKQLAPFLVTHGESALNEYRRDIIAAIALFRAVLVNSTDHKTTANGPVKQQQQLASIQTIPSLCNSPLDSGLSIGVEAKTRYMLARVLLEHTDNDNEAITQARKVIHLTQRTLGMKSIRMGAYEIQIQIQIRMGQFRVARASLKDAQNEAERLKLHGWYYHFIMQQLKLLRSDMLARNKPTFTAQLAILLDTIEYARENKHEDVQICFLLLRAQYALLANDSSTVKQSLLGAENCLAGWQYVDVYLELSNDVQVARPNVGTSILHARYHLLHVLNGLHYGNTQSAFTSFHQLQDILSWWTLVDTELTGQNKYTNYMISNEDVMQHVRIQWLSRRQIASISIYLFATVYHRQMSTVTARELTLDGIKQLIIMSNGIQDSNATSMRQSVAWYDQMRARYWLLLVDTYLASNDIEQASIAWEAVTLWCRSRNIWTLFIEDLVLRHAWIMQLSGQSAEAKKCYKILMQHDHHAITATIGLSTLELEKEDTDEVESRLDLDALSLTLVQDMAANLLASFQNLSRQEKKQRLSNALRLANRAENGQLHRFILARLAEIYYSVADEQCEIMLDTAYHLAREINDHFLAIVVGGRLADLYRRHGRKEMADHLYKEVNTLKQRAYQPITDV